MEQQRLIESTIRVQACEVNHTRRRAGETRSAKFAGTTISLLPSSLIHAYGDKAIPIVRKAMTDSPDIWVRKSAAEELVRKGDPAAFGFFLDAIVNHRWRQNTAYEPQLIRFLKDTFPAALPRSATRATVVQFLRVRSQTKENRLTPRAAR